MQVKQIIGYFFFRICSTSAVAIILIALITGCSEDLSQSTEAKNALTQLKQVDSEIELGTNKIDYNRQVKESKIDVDQFNGSIKYSKKL